MTVVDLINQLQSLLMINPALSYVPAVVEVARSDGFHLEKPIVEVKEFKAGMQAENDANLQSGQLFVRIG